MCFSLDPAGSHPVRAWSLLDTHSALFVYPYHFGALSVISLLFPLLSPQYETTLLATGVTMPAYTWMINHNNNETRYDLFGYEQFGYSRFGTYIDELFIARLRRGWLIG